MVRPVPSLSLLMKSLTLSPWLTPTILSTLASRPGLLTGLQPPEISWNISRTQQESVPCSSPHPTQSVESCHKQEDQVYRCWRQDLHETCCCCHSVHLGWYLVLKIVPVLMSSSLTCRISFRSKLSWAVSSLSLSSTRCSNVCHNPPPRTPGCCCYVIYQPESLHPTLSVLSLFVIVDSPDVIQLIVETLHGNTQGSPSLSSAAHPSHLSLSW